MIRPLVNKSDIANAYKAMAEDKEREADALTWCNGLAGDMADASR